MVRRSGISTALAAALATWAAGESASQVAAAWADASARVQSREGELTAAVALAAYEAGEFERAGELFATLATGERGEARGVLQARAADALERAGYAPAAAELYHAAGTALPEIAAWLSLREARASGDSGLAFSLLGREGDPRRRLVLEVRAGILLASGDTVGAVRDLSKAGLPVAAAWLALAGNDTARARDLVYGALEHRDTAEIRRAIEAAEGAEGTLGPRSPADFRALAEGHGRLNRVREAAALARRAVALGDTSVEALVLLGRLELARRQSADARAAFRRAASLRSGGSAGLVAEYEYARLLLRSVAKDEGRRALLSFADRHPAHRLAPIAAYLVADSWLAEGDASAGDALLAPVVRRWPRSRYASRSRMRLARLALDRGDTAGAVGWYEAEIRAGGTLLYAARFACGLLRWEAGEAAAAVDIWRELAQRDSLGYYGALAREAAALPDPVMADSPLPHPSRRVARALSALDRLMELAWAEEADELVLHWMGRRDLTTDEQLALGDGLIERSWVSQGVTLGWRASRSLTLHDARVLRVVFPWPFRQLIVDEAREHGVDPYLVAALIRQESVFRPTVTSRAGAQGLMQLMPPTARELAGRLGVAWDDQLLATPDANLHMGLAHLTGLIDRYGGDVTFALAAYNAGGSPVERWRRAWGGREAFFFVEGIPYRETRSYVRSVLRTRALYRALYPTALSQQTDPK